MRRLARHAHFDLAIAHHRERNDGRKSKKHRISRAGDGLRWHISGGSRGGGGGGGGQGVATPPKAQSHTYKMHY